MSRFHAYWPGITQADMDAQPRLANEPLWTIWLATVSSDVPLFMLLHKLELTPLTSQIFRKPPHFTELQPHDEVWWVTPDEYLIACRHMTDLIDTRSRKLNPILKAYPGAEKLDVARAGLKDDMRDLGALVGWVKDRGVAEMTTVIL